MKIRTVLFAMLLSGAPAAFAQPTAEVSVSIGGEAVASVDVFYDQLSPYGAWAADDRFGQVFIPAEANFVPYTNGHWAYTDAGMVWVSAEPYAWATTHYGRWMHHDGYNRWVWIPDTTWGPSWVDWRETDGEFGWAPLLPDGVEAPIEAWHFCPPERVFETDVVRYYEPRERVRTIYREARPIERNNRTVVVEKLKEKHVTVRPVKLEAKQLGRQSASEKQAAEVHARDHKDEIATRNKAQLEKIAPKAKPPARLETKPEPKKTEPQKVEPKKPEPQKTEPQKRPEPQKVEPKKPEPQKTEPQKPEPQKTEPQKRPEPQVKKPEPRPEPQRVEPPKPEPKHETPGPQRPEPQTRAPAPAPKPEPQTSRKPEPKREPAKKDDKKPG